MATLNGVSMHSVDPAIVIQSIDEQAPSWNVTAVSRAGRIGQYCTGTEKRYRDIIIKFAVRITRDYAAREAVLQKVAAWAAPGGTLKVNYRTGQQINVICAALPAVQGIDKWANAYQLTLRAYGVPEWQNVTADSVQGGGTGATGTAFLSVSANGGGKLAFNAQNDSGSTCDTAQVKVGSQIIRFEGLALADGETLSVGYDSSDNMTAVARSMSSERSVLDKRTTASVDDIWLSGTSSNFIQYEGSIKLRWWFHCYGRWIG